ncbi:MAG: Holliday junction branch migration protein RuvA [Anaerolineales bacterium]|jgi:Holliday junction DNA helicase RuvA
MIASLRGRVEQVEEGRLVVEISGVGFQVAVPGPVAEHARVGQPVALFTRLLVREDALALFGFETADQRMLFDLLLGVEGVGPKVALSLLSHLPSEAFRQAVARGQPERLTGIPGVGRKTAEKIVFHLKDKIHALAGAEESGWVEADADILAALTSLGYTALEAQSAIQSLPRDAPVDAESRLKLVLQYFAPR